MVREFRCEWMGAGDGVAAHACPPRRRLRPFLSSPSRWPTIVPTTPRTFSQSSNPLRCKAEDFAHHRQRPAAKIVMLREAPTSQTSPRPAKPATAPITRSQLRHDSCDTPPTGHPQRLATGTAESSVRDPALRSESAAFSIGIPKNEISLVRTAVFLS